VDFTGNFPSKGRLSGSVDVPADGGVALRPYHEELSPDRGEHCSEPGGTGVLGVLIANFSKILILKIGPLAGPSSVEDLPPS
jgi:hypothetical protein